MAAVQVTTCRGRGHIVVAPLQAAQLVMTPPLIGGALSDACLTSVSLSVAYIGPKSRTERPKKTIIGIEVAHVARDSDTAFKVKRSRSPGRFTQRGLNARGRCSGDRENVLGVGNYCYVASARRRARRWGAHEERRGTGHIVAAAHSLLTLTGQKLLEWSLKLCMSLVLRF